MPDPSSTTPNPLIGKAIPGDYILLRFDLVDALGGDFAAAIVFTKILWKCERRPEGWPATWQTLQQETRLSEHKIKGAVKKLLAGGYITRRDAGKFDKSSIWEVPGLHPSDVAPEPEPEPEPDPQDPQNLRDGENHRIEAGGSPEPSQGGAESSHSGGQDPQDLRDGENHRIGAVETTGSKRGKSPTLPMRARDKTPPPPSDDVTDTSVEQAGGAHPHENNARQALTRLRADTRLNVSENALMVMAFEAGKDGDPWDGYLKIRNAVDAGMVGTYSHGAALRHRLGLPKMGSTQGRSSRSRS